MTLPDFDEKIAMELPESQLDVGKTVRKVMINAFEEKRLTCGVCNCANQLELYPEQVMICILPEIVTQDYAVRIQHTLMEAYCRENGINVVKVGTDEEFCKMFKNTNDNNTSTINTLEHLPLERKCSSRDFGCFLVKLPETMSPVDNMLNSFCDDSKPDEDHVVVEIPG